MNLRTTTIALSWAVLVACAMRSSPMLPVDGGRTDGGRMDASEGSAPSDVSDESSGADEPSGTDVEAAAQDAREDGRADDIPGASGDVGGADAAPSRSDAPRVGEPLHADAPVCIARLIGGSEYMLATACDGSLWAWGDNDRAGIMQPGGMWSDGPDVRSRPQRIVGISNARGHVRRTGDCVIAGPEGAGSIYCWGRSSFEELGHGDSWDQWRYPHRIEAALDVVRAANSGTVIRSDLRGWGFLGHAGEHWHQFPLPPGASQELGGAGGVHWVNGGVIAMTVFETYYEQGLRRLDGVVDIKGGYAHSCVLTADGRVRCWGMNDFGEAGNFREGDRCGAVPPGVGYCHRALAEVAGVDQVVKIACDIGNTCAVRRDGTLWCWGYNQPLRDGRGSIGDGRAPSETCGHDNLGHSFPCSRRPVQVAGLRDVVDVAFYDGGTCALSSSGAVYCWGRNESGALADGTRDDRSTPTLVRWN